MRNSFQHIFWAVILSVFTFSLSSCKEEGIIDESDMAQIYAEMLLTDQWITSTTGARQVADTSLVYEPILRKYGYTSADYRKSVEYYLQDPEEYADIMTMTIKILDARLAGLKERKVEVDKQKERDEYVKSMALNLKFDKEWPFKKRSSDKDRYDVLDSLALHWDSVMCCYKMTQVAWSQKSSLTDSLEILDSLPKYDTLPAADTCTLKKIKEFKPRPIKRNAALKLGDSLTKIQR